METEAFTIFSPDGMTPDEGAIKQMKNVMSDERAVKGALMADHHKGYSMPIGGVVAYEDAVSPTGVGFDIGCGNKAVRTSLNMRDFGLDIFPEMEVAPKQYEEARKFINAFKPYMRNIQKKVSFGLGRSSGKNIDHELFDDDRWFFIRQNFPGLEEKARQQLGTVGSGNHYVDLLVDENDGQIWIANHFGSRGLGHTIASGFMAAAANQGFTDRVPESENAVVLPTDTDLGNAYIGMMQLAGDYAYAGRDYVADQVLKILGAKSTFEVHNHHNYAWKENGLWVVRKGATPLTNEPAFIGGSMGDISVIVRGVTERHIHDGSYPVEDIGNLGSAPHGAGRVMSRTKAAGKFKKVKTTSGKKIRVRDASTGAINWPEVRSSLEQQGIVVLGAGADEAPGVYKNLSDVLKAHDNIEVLHTLRPLGVVMAGEDTHDPYKD